MKELDQFTVERLQAFIDKPLDNGLKHSEQMALAKIALAAKTAEPIGKVSLSDFRSDGTREAKVVCLHDQADWENFTDGTLLFLTPPVNSPVIPDGWVSCSERLPEDDEFVLVWPLPDFGVELHVGQYCEYHIKGDGWYAQVYEQNYGIEWCQSK